MKRTVTVKTATDKVHPLGFKIFAKTAFTVPIYQEEANTCLKKIRDYFDCKHRLWFLTLVVVILPVPTIIQKLFSLPVNS